MASMAPVAQSRSITRGLVLSGGGGRGAFQCGVIEALSSAGWHPDVLVGTSIGSHNAALWATGGAARVEEFWGRVKTSDMHRFLRRSPWHGLMDRSPWERMLRATLGADELASAATPLYLVATNITTGQPEIFTNHVDLDSAKPLYRKVTLGYEHLLASSAIPLVYPPVRIGGSRYWDGAVMYNSPLNPAIEAGASEVIAVLLSPFRDLRTIVPSIRDSLPPPLPGLVGQIGLVLDLAITATFENDYYQLQRVNDTVGTTKAKAAHRAVRCAVIAPEEWISPLDIVRYQQERITQLRAQGRAAAQLALESLGQR